MYLYIQKFDIQCFKYQFQTNVLYLDLSVKKMEVAEKIIRVESFSLNISVYKCYIHGSKWMKFFFHISKKN